MRPVPRFVTIATDVPFAASRTVSWAIDSVSSSVTGAPTTPSALMVRMRRRGYSRYTISHVRPVQTTSSALPFSSMRRPAGSSSRPLRSKRAP